MRRLLVAALTVFTALAATSTLALADWPTTCIEANDAFERDAGHMENVGIYQRVYGNWVDAESACRRDHFDNLRATFAWAFPEVPQPEQQSRAQPRIDPQLQWAWDLMYSTRVGELLEAPNLHTVRVRVGQLKGRALAGYAYETHTIWVDSRLLQERQIAIAAVLGHEAWHAVSGVPRPRTIEHCITDEVWASMFEGMIWLELSDGWAVPETTVELGIQATTEVVRSDFRGGSGPEDIGSWEDILVAMPATHASVLYERGYVQHCAA